MGNDFLFDAMSLPPELVSNLRRMNPWWSGHAMQLLPRTRRHLVLQIHRRLDQRLASIVAVRGPRQIGKTTSQLQVLADLLQRGVPPKNILRVQFDELPAFSGIKEPILRIVDWFEKNILGSGLNDVARQGLPTYLFFDEVQNLGSWAEQLKSLVDSTSTAVVVTGSSALRIELGRDSLAGRVNTIEAGVLSLTEIASFRGVDLGGPFLEENGLEPLTRQEFWRDLASHGRRFRAARDQTFKLFSGRGGYPLAHERADVPWGRIADQLNETVIQRVIQHDLRIGERGRKRDAPLLEEVFRLACRYVGQSPALHTLAREVQRALAANVGPQRIHHYLKFLGNTLLLRLIEPLEIRLKRRRGNSKICLADHGLRASWLQEMVPLDPESLASEPHLQSLAGHIAESVTGASLMTISHLDLAHLPARGGDPEIDFILTVGPRRIPLEVKYQRRIDPQADTEGLRTFMERAVNNAPFALLITQSEVDNVIDPRIISMPLSTLMLLR